MTELSIQSAEILRAARLLLSDPEQWTQTVHARNACGDPVKPTDPDAVRWCIYGAIAHFSPGGCIPFDLLRRMDAAVPVFSPEIIGDEDWDVGELNDKVFDHPTMLRFIDFLLDPQSPC
jgi:hypothetical protein